jgi:hypothetical protein
MADPPSPWRTEMADRNETVGSGPICCVRRAVHLRMGSPIDLMPPAEKPPSRVRSSVGRKAQLGSGASCAVLGRLRIPDLGIVTARDPRDSVWQSIVEKVTKDESKTALREGAAKTAFAVAASWPGSQIIWRNWSPLLRRKSTNDMRQRRTGCRRDTRARRTGIGGRHDRPLW